VDCPGLPQKLLNYMASGRAIVSFAGSAKVLTHEVNGLIVPNHDVEGFAAAIVRLVDDPALGARLGQAARAYVLATSTWDRTAERCERVYASLLGLEPMPTGEFQPEPLLPMTGAPPGPSTLTTVP
jgi:glycosyltransferase involved in cell wall biosynthesis